MEKKGKCLTVASSKGVSSDSNKKSQDGVGSKVWPRGGRRREPNGGSLQTKSEPISTRKPMPPRFNKCFEKKPRLRRTPTTGTVHLATTETTGLEYEEEAQLGSVFIPGSKKQSLNHLLNFTYEPYVPEGRRQSTARISNNSNNNKLFYSKKHKYNKEHFLQANCQFIVNASGEYKQYLNNPDALVDWDLVEQVNVHVTEYPACPICLYPPVAAKITKCGHIYCWSCILHYLALSDQAWRKCPICYDAIQKKDLRSVVNIPHNSYNVTDDITFKLMKRRKGSLIAYPATAAIAYKEDVFFNVSDVESECIYSKLLIANCKEISSIIAREFNELHAQKLEAENCPEICFIDEALAILNLRKNSVIDNTKQHFEENIPKETFDIIEENNEKGNNCDSSIDQPINTVENEDTFNIESLDISDNINNKIDKFHYFYQASDGQHIYLHAVNARMVEHNYGSLEFGPQFITGKILEKEGGSMDEEQRKRLRYLQHLPLTCQFEVAEIQLKEPIISKETLEHFYDQLETRKKRRQRRAKEEKKREKRIATVENRLLGKPSPTLKNLHIDSESQFPCFSQSVEESSPNSTPAGSWTREPEILYAGPSFAKIIAEGTKKSPQSAPSVTAKSQPPVKLINVTGAKIQCNFNSLRHHPSDSDSDVDGFEPVPHVSSLADAIEQALQKKDKTESNQFDSSAMQQGKKNKKKKKQQKLLFVNSISHGK